MEGYGDRCLGELKLEAPTYRTDPQMLRAQVLSGKSVELPRINEGRRKALSPFVKRARRGIENREISRMNRSRLFGISRDIFLGIGDILVRNGQLEKPQDVFDLHMSELTSLDDMRQTVVRRRADEEHFRAMPGFSRLVYSGRITDHKASNEGLPAVREGRLTGIPTSCGIIEGEVLVVEQACCGMDTTGKILVTRSTDPGWVFLIKNAAGIIAERGSLLSHTAIISRVSAPKFVHRYGYYECRCKFQKDPKTMWSAFWTQSPSIGSRFEPEWCGVESDIMEHFDTGEATTGNIYGGYGNQLKNDGRVEYKLEDTEDGFHYFGMDWREDGYTFYCDGKEISRCNEHVSHVPQFILITTEVVGYRRVDQKEPEKLPYVIKGEFEDDAFIIDFVRVFDRVEK